MGGQAKQRYHQELEMLVKQVDVDKVELVQLLAHEFLAYQGMKVGWNVTLSLLSHGSHSLLFKSTRSCRISHNGDIQY